MKFGKRLQSQLEETLPEWRDKYLSYKQLKKRLKLISAVESFTEAVLPNTVAPSDLNAGDGDSRRMPVDTVESPDSLAEALAPATSVAAAVSSDSSVNGVEAVTEEVGRKLSSGSVIIDPHLPKLIGATDFKNITAEEVDFIHLLDAELEKFNAFFIEKEEEYVIRLQELKERIERMKEKGGNGEGLSSENVNEEMIDIRKDIVNFHGEMVLLENYSSLNYTGLVKILKKHDKRTGALLRMPFIQNVLHQPFFTTELLSKLVQECEMNLHSLFPSASSNGGTLDRSCVCGRPGGCPAQAQRDVFTSQKADNADVETIYRSTVAALRTIKDLRRGSSTYNVFSLPPFSRSDSDFEDGAGNSNLCCATIPVCTKH